MTPPKTYTAFVGDRRLAAGALADVLAAVQAQPARTALVFADDSGELVKLNTPAEIATALAEAPTPPTVPQMIEARLLPRHVAWLQAQPGGPSAAIRRLVDAARQAGTGRSRQAQEAAYRFISMVAGDHEGFEAASRALFAGDRALFDAAMASWPADLRRYSLDLAGDGVA